MKCSKRIYFTVVVILAIINLWIWLENSGSAYERSIQYYVVKIVNYTNERIYTVTSATSSGSGSQMKCSECMVLAIVSCGERFDETSNLIKSAVALSTKFLTIRIFTEDSLIPKFVALRASWPENVRRRVTLNVHIASYPQGFIDETWRNLFRQCASVRLFLPVLLPDIDSVIYTDTDVLLLGPLENIWKHFHKMNSSQMVAMVQEHEDPAYGWYNRFAKHPFYGKLGLNSGVMLMNLTRLRKFGWVDYLSPILRQFHTFIKLGDQDIINIIFHYHPDKLYLFGCDYNYRPDHCMYMSVCKSAEQNGVFALHGNRRVFFNQKQPSFKAVYSAFDEYNLGGDLRQHLYYPMQKYLLGNSSSNCGKISKIFLKNLASMVSL